MAGPCLRDTPTAEMTVDETGATGTDVLIAGRPGSTTWDLDAPVGEANGLAWEPTLGPNGGLHTRPRPYVTNVTAADSLFPSQTETNLANESVNLTNGSPDVFELANPSPHLPAIAWIYVGCPIHYLNTNVAADDADETLASLQVSLTGWAGTFNQRDYTHFYGIGALTVPSLNDCFAIAIDPGDTRELAARVRVTVTGSCQSIARDVIKLRALVLAV